MAFDQPTRNRLAKFVGDARTLLTEEFTRQLQHEYGLDPTSGEVTSIEKLTALDDARRETARILRETMDYYLAGKQRNDSSRRDVLDRIVREQAFTVLNRLCALRMAEGRGLLIESTGRGYQSKGFQLYTRLAGSALGETGDAYRSYLFSVFDEFAVDLPALFDRFSPEGRLFPRENKLLELLGLINDAEIDPLWVDDETIGWIYQYFNSQEERKQMRAESSAPRNSRELAVRNQFFTPRYVVEFLTDNTLGRIWYEMTKGETALKETCRYLVHYPYEIFLEEGEEVPTQELQGEDFSQEELLRQPVYISHRPLKDPREIKMLDPACGSMHFGLYAFDLFEQIYAEAWELEEKLGVEALWRINDLGSLHDTYPDKETFLHNVPHLIIECNIHGIDIDPRAVQIAGLSLWLRAQKSWQLQEVKPDARSQIRKSNIVCAEPMPGDQTMLDEFLFTLTEDRLETLMRKVLRVPTGQKVRATKAMADALARLVRTVWQEMKLAGEAGSLLKVEETLRDSITTARKESEEKAPLFRVLEYGMEYQTDRRVTQSKDKNTSDFWSLADALVIAALHDYAEQATNGSIYRRRLFAEDTAQEFAFIDLCRKHFDVAVMNPPFGEGTSKSKQLMTEAYSARSLDIGMAFVERAVSSLTPNGYVGALTNRNFIANETLEQWRQNYLLGYQHSTLHLLLDLGYDVLDEALVEVAAYVICNITRRNAKASFIRLLETIEKQESLVEYFNKQYSASISFFTNKSLSVFDSLPNHVLCYWLPEKILLRLAGEAGITKLGGMSRRGPDTGDDFRFLATYWEVPINEIGINKKWVPYAKGGEYAPFYDDVHLALMWKDDGKEIRNFFDENGNLRSRPQGTEHLFRSGLTYPRRTTSDFSPRPLQKNTAFGGAGQSIFFETEEKEIGYLLGAYTRSFKMVVEAFVGSGDTAFSGSAAKLYRTGLIESLPHPLSSIPEKMVDIAIIIFNAARSFYKSDETTRYFTGTRILDNGSSPNLRKGFWFSERNRLLNILRIIDNFQLFDDYVATNIFQVSQPDTLNQLVGIYPNSYMPSDNFVDIILDLYDKDEDAIKRIAVEKFGGKRQLTKKSYFADRKLELISHALEINIHSVVGAVLINEKVNTLDVRDGTAELVSWLLGCIIGRWDIRFSTRNDSALELSDPFAPLPVCSPGMLRNTKGLPPTQQDVPDDYPLRITWGGILADDEGRTDDVEVRVREALHVIWQERAEIIEQEACQILGARSLREYFQKPAGFFAYHLKRYSKSRRQAPIYWPLATLSGSYTIWLYYHRLTDQTLFSCVNDFVDPKLKQVSAETARLRQKKGRGAADEKELERLADLERELKDFRAELLRVAAFWKPNLNDGVQITAAPLWKLFQHKPWQKKLKETWEKLERGDYDWAHLAHSIWPERVREKCKTDKSLAIAHGLEELYVESRATSRKKKVRQKKNVYDVEGWFEVE